MNLFNLQAAELDLTLEESLDVQIAEDQDDSKTFMSSSTHERQRDEGGPTPLRTPYKQRQWATKHPAQVPEVRLVPALPASVLRGLAGHRTRGGAAVYLHAHTARQELCQVTPRQLKAAARAMIMEASLILQDKQ